MAETDDEPIWEKVTSPSPAVDTAPRLAERFRFVRSLQAPYGWGAVRLGLLIPVLPAAGWGLARLVARESPMAVFFTALTWFSLILALGVLISGAWDLAWNRRRPLDPARPWERERRWAAHGAEIRTDGIGYGTLIAAVPFGIVGFALQGSTDWTRELAYVSFGVCGLFLLSTFLMTRSRGLHLTWPSLPIPAGEPFALRLGTLPGGSRFQSIRVVLRVIDERGRFPLPRPVHAGAHLVWAHEWRLEGEDVPAPGGDVELLVRPPADAPGTRLRAVYPSYWELEVELRGTGAYLSRRLLLPVYAVGASGDEADVEKTAARG